jgi:hypothetical protein
MLVCCTLPSFRQTLAAPQSERTLCGVVTRACDCSLHPVPGQRDTNHGHKEEEEEEEERG